MRFAARVLALPAALAVTAAAPTDPLAAVAAANGHAAQVHIHATAARVVEGRTLEIAVDQLGTQRLVRRCLAQVCDGAWFDGRRLWRFGLNEVLLPDDDDVQLPVRRTLVAIVSYAFAEPAFRAAGGRVDAAGRDAWRVRALDGASLTAQLDSHTRAVRRIVDENGAVVETFSRETHVANASFALTRAGVDDEQMDQATAAAGPIEPPVGVRATFAGDGALRLGGDVVPIVSCTLGGRSARCLLDTGATPSAIALPFAESLGLEPRGELEIAGFSRFVTGFVEAGPLSVGAATFARARFAIVPAVTSARFDVVVGADLLARLHVKLDRARANAAVTAPANLPSGNAVALRFHDGVPTVGATFAGDPVTALLDTGDASTISLGYEAYRRGPQWPVAERLQASGVAGGSDAFAVTIPDVRVGPIALGAVRATVNRTQERAHVGIGVWSRCVVDLDELNERFSCRGS